MAKTNGERLAVVENEVKNVINEVHELKTIIKEGFHEMNTRLDEAARKLDEASNDFVPRQIFDATIAELKRKSWQGRTLSFILGSVLTFLVGFVLLKITGG